MMGGVQNPIVEDDFNGFCIVTVKILNSYVVARNTRAVDKK